MTQGKIYFVSAPGRIKIGYTLNPDTRLMKLRNDDMEELEIIAIRDGTRKIEKKLHGMVAEHCVKGEWFRDCTAVRTVIEDYLAGRHRV
jgi:hypothetical protein